MFLVRSATVPLRRAPPIRRVNIRITRRTTLNPPRLRRLWKNNSRFVGRCCPCTRTVQRAAHAARRRRRRRASCGTRRCGDTKAEFEACSSRLWWEAAEPGVPGRAHATRRCPMTRTSPNKPAPTPTARNAREAPTSASLRMFYN